MTLEGHDEVPTPVLRDPAVSLRGCRRILVLGGNGPDRSSLAHLLAQARVAPHVELEGPTFEPRISTASMPVLRERAIAAIARDRWVADCDSCLSIDLAWPRADTVVWLDYPPAARWFRLGEYRRRLVAADHAHLAVVRLRSPLATRQWWARVTG